MKEFRKNPAICGRCGGHCCRQMPGAAVPADFDHDVGRVIRALASGLWAIDWWEAERPGYYLRPAIFGRQGELFHRSWGGSCVFLGPRGCRLRRRPAQCRNLEPRADGECHLHGLTKRAVARAWGHWRSVFEAPGG